MPRVLGFALAFAGVVWVAALLAAPGGLAAGSALAAWFYDACGLICHQRPERSFALGGVAMPVCARCLGLYASGALGAVVASLDVRRLDRIPELEAGFARALVLVAAVPTAFTLLVEWSGMLQPGSIGRAVAAIPLGGTVGWLLVRTVHTAGAPIAREQMRYHP